VQEEVLEPGFAHLPELSLTSDLDHRAWMTDRDRAADVDPASVVDDAVRQALTVAGSCCADRHRLGDLVLDPAFSGSHRWRFVAPELLPAWERLRRVVPDHARPRCEEMVLWCSAAPESPDRTA